MHNNKLTLQYSFDMFDVMLGDCDHRDTDCQCYDKAQSEEVSMPQTFETLQAAKSRWRCVVWWERIP